ncbi:MAG: BglII/BstYI family type II restriction endonuclease, partial [Gammaproteobacteria bacterium]|nr:BglII/BstYI family type II restriction endonuclease [Gammaproteobacteria bacterium]
MNGEEFLLVHKPKLWQEVQDVIASVDAEACRTKVSKEITKRGRRLYSPIDMNKAFKEGLESFGWKSERRNFWVTQDEQLL